MMGSMSNAAAASPSNSFKAAPAIGDESPSPSSSSSSSSAPSIAGHAKAKEIAAISEKKMSEAQVGNGVHGNHEHGKAEDHAGRGHGIGHDRRLGNGYADDGDDEYGKDDRETRHAMGAMGRNKWYAEHITADMYQVCRLKSTRTDRSTAYQHMEIIDTAPFGPSLLLDGRMQSATADEWVFHEALVHPALIAHPCPKRVFIGGGGEGATAREVLRHKSVEKCVMVDIDEEVVLACKKHLPSRSAGAFDDPRLELHFDDAKKILLASPYEFDIIIFDLADPLEEGPCYLLYTIEFYQTLKRKLAPGGIFVTQSGPAGMFTMRDVFTPINRTLSQVWKKVYPSVVHMFSFADSYGFNLASDTYDVAELDIEEVDKRIEERIKGGTKVLKFYDGTTHRSIHHLPKHVRAAVASEERTITESKPLYVRNYGQDQTPF